MFQNERWCIFTIAMPITPKNVYKGMYLKLLTGLIACLFIFCWLFPIAFSIWVTVVPYFVFTSRIILATLWLLFKSS